MNDSSTYPPFTVYLDEDGYPTGDKVRFPEGYRWQKVSGDLVVYPVRKFAVMVNDIARVTLPDSMGEVARFREGHWLRVVCDL